MVKCSQGSLCYKYHYEGVAAIREISMSLSKQAVATPTTNSDFVPLHKGGKTKSELELEGNDAICRMIESLSVRLVVIQSTGTTIGIRDILAMALFVPTYSCCPPKCKLNKADVAG